MTERIDLLVGGGVVVACKVNSSMLDVSFRMPIRYLCKSAQLQTELRL